LFHSGVECGQGIHTKAAQVCAYKLGIPIEMISVKYANNLVSPNSQCTGGSITSELIADVYIFCKIEIILNLI
jgi:xanthine dehydrogenase/oxidase